MKKLFFFIFLLFVASRGMAQNNFLGAWQYQQGEVRNVMIITPTYFTIATYAGNKFYGTYGGTWKPQGEKEVVVSIEFNSDDKSQVGQSASVPVDFINDKLVVTQQGSAQEWSRVDEGKGPLAGAWRITAREQDGKMNPIPEGARKTLKVLSGGRFQWMAINTDTGEFMGSGGGAYTFDNGKYTEHIEFFSRDDSKAGLSLTFNDKVTDTIWEHNGVSTQGKPVHEVWSR
ncbi:membrane or secreted protein [Chitinophaga vietnamensis]|uniref:membrane or secreted protein n=1 Tax=Chitinophaga vietnamensis TaxID=2593957 RepID=UPI0011784BBE|nr:membrane or secreted protein [Chitinophaga vietnamensis]